MRSRNNNLYEESYVSVVSSGVVAVVVDTLVDEKRQCRKKGNVAGGTMAGVGCGGALVGGGMLGGTKQSNENYFNHHFHQEC